MTVPETARLRSLEDESRRLKKLPPLGVDVIVDQ
jgi:hypothetical protein